MLLKISEEEIAFVESIIRPIAGEDPIEVAEDE